MSYVFLSFFSCQNGNDAFSSRGLIWTKNSSLIFKGEFRFVVLFSYYNGIVQYLSVHCCINIVWITKTFEHVDSQVKIQSLCLKDQRSNLWSINYIFYGA